MPKSLFALFPLALLLGCTQNDSEHLGKISRKAIGYLETGVGGPQGQVITGYQAVLGSLGEPMLGNRVATRLNWDKMMGDTRVEVNLVSSGVVKLTGQVKEDAQKQRAMEVAQNTTGVTKVINEVVVVVDPSKSETKSKGTKAPEKKPEEVKKKEEEVKPVESNHK